MDPNKVMDELLTMYDWQVRCIDETRNDYQCGYADAIGQVVLNQQNYRHILYFPMPQ